MRTLHTRDFQRLRWIESSMRFDPNASISDSIETHSTADHSQVGIVDDEMLFFTSAAAGIPHKNINTKRIELNLLSFGMWKVSKRMNAFNSTIRHIASANIIWNRAHISE